MSKPTLFAQMLAFIVCVAVFLILLINTLNHLLG